MTKLELIDRGLANLRGNKTLAKFGLWDDDGNVCALGSLVGRKRRWLDVSPQERREIIKAADFIAGLLPDEVEVMSPYPAILVTTSERMRTSYRTTAGELRKKRVDIRGILSGYNNIPERTNEQVICLFECARELALQEQQEREVTGQLKVAP